MLGRWGFHAKTIKKVVEKYHKKKVSLSTVYKTCHKNGVLLRAYRNGETRESQKLIDGLVAPKNSKKRNVSISKKTA